MCSRQIKSEKVVAEVLRCIWIFSTQKLHFASIKSPMKMCPPVSSSEGSDSLVVSNKGHVSKDVAFCREKGIKLLREESTVWHCWGELRKGL